MVKSHNKNDLPVKVEEVPKEVSVAPPRPSSKKPVGSSLVVPPSQQSAQGPVPKPGEPV